MRVRYFSHQTHDAVTNMAVDQVLVQSAAESGTHCLRLYGWSQPTLSIGYFQHHVDGDHYRGEHAVAAAVRRSTGGGAIVHHHDLTYAIALSTDGRTSADRDRLYRQTHTAIAEVLLGLGVIATRHGNSPAAPIVAAANPFLCFERRAEEDLLVSDYKILGSAQRRIRGGLLQHGSVLLAASIHAAGLPGVRELTTVRIDDAALANQLSNKLGDSLGWSLEPSTLRDEEWAAVQSLAGERFGAAAWWSQR